MANFEEARVKLTNNQPKNSSLQQRKTIGITKKNFQSKELPHSLLLKTKQKIKIRNAFANNMPTDIKLSTAQLSKTMKSGGFLGALLGKLPDLLMKILPLPENVQALFQLSLDVFQFLLLLHSLVFQ